MKKIVRSIYKKYCMTEIIFLSQIKEDVNVPTYANHLTVYHELTGYFFIDKFNLILYFQFLNR
jgi:hypothetical protein